MAEGDVSFCVKCNKTSYSSYESASKAANHIAKRRKYGPSEIYKCHFDSRVWHLANLRRLRGDKRRRPDDVKRNRFSR